MFDLTSLTNPFPGLRPFEAHENHLFFGRDGQSDDLLQRLSRQRFLAVVGTSGSGKSSLVRAGLLPALHGGFMLRAGSNWRVAILRPGSNPIGRLTQALCREDVLGVKDIEEAIQLSITEASLRRSTLGLIDVVRQARMIPQENLLVVVDQFEELFRVKANSGAGKADDAAALVKLLLEATNQSELPIYVLITMRSDFLGDCSQFRDLPEAINDGQYLIPRMTRDQRREAINGPIAVGGAQIAPRLVNRLLNEVGDNPDQLPVLQHALMRMWQQWEKAGDTNAPLDLSHYEAIGGLDEAISQHADEAYDELATDRSQRITEILFKLLTERGTDNREIRRPTRLAEICAVAEAKESEVLAIIEAFRQEGRSFLMPPPGVKLRPNTFIDISHESLIRGWRRLQRWVDDEALSARIYRRLAETAMLHQAGEAGLWRDPDLVIALAWREKNHPNAAWGARYSSDFDAAMSFLEESRCARDAERMERERMRRRNLRLMQALAAVFLIGLCASLALAAYAFQQRQQAKTQALQAEESARSAEQNAQRARDAEATARREKERAEENAQIAKQAEAKAKESALLAEKSAEQASRNLKTAQEANTKLVAAEASTRKALDKAVKAREDAQNAEKTAINEKVAAEESKRRAYALSLRFRRDSIESNYQRLKMAQRLGEISPAEERAYWLTQQGDAIASLGNSEGAINLFKSVLDEDPNNFAALSARGSQYLISQNAERALIDIDRSMKINNKLPYLYLNKALGQSYLGEYDRAIETTRQGVDIFSHLGYAEYKERNVADEIESITGQKTIYADSNAMLTVFYYDIANLAASSGSKDFAAVLEAANARPNSFDAQLYALNLSLLNYKKRPKDYGSLVAQGALWERAGYCGKASESYDAFRKEHERERDPRYDALAKWLANSSREKLQSTAAGCRNVPQNEKTAPAYMLDMMEYAWSGDFVKAEKVLTTVINETKDDPDFLIERMKFRYFNKGDFAGAKEDAESLIKMNKGTALAFLLRAMAKAQLNTSDMTIIDDVSKAKQLNPATLPIINDLGGGGTNGKMLLEVVAKTNRDEAIDLLERYIRYIEPSSYPHYLLAKLLNDKSDFKKALAQINIAIALDRTRFEYFDEKLRAEAGASGNTGETKQANQNPITAQRNKFIYYSDAGDTLSKRVQIGMALYAYGESLKALDEITGQTKNAEDIQCEVATTVEKIFNLLRAQGPKDDALQYIDKLSGLNNISRLIQSELKKLSATP
jgi:energy-coupling factor transporter ATP-binding protein EcfA2